MTLPWLLLGDFNQIVYTYEKSRGIPASDTRLKPFWDVIRACDLIDLGFLGSRFTWTNMRKGHTNVQEMLYRVLGNRVWMVNFPEARVAHLTRTRSDHCPIMVYDGRATRNTRVTKSFRLQAAWFLHPQFEGFLVNCWTYSQ